ncbi:MAG: acetyl-CoA synthetase, partial [Proteobacteria bacterium]|nr:acetyl-CoA synthetase [Pseudomonadota bacterium]
MLKKGIRHILSASKDAGWVLEPQAKHLFSLVGLDVPRFTMSTTAEEAVRFAHEIGYPVVAKVVSPRIVHKSESDGVAVGIDSDGELTKTFTRLSRIDGFVGVLVEEMM